MKALMIAEVGVRRDEDGRFCLNDLHKAAGGERKHGPSLWMENTQTKELIAEIGDTGNPVSVLKGGTVQGTYVCKELVYAYAMWISPKFHLQVIRAYDALAMVPVKALPHRRPERPEIEANKVFRSFFGIGKLIGLDKNQAALSANEAAKRLTGNDPLGAMEVTHLLSPVQEVTLTPTELGREIGLVPHHVNKRLAALGLQEKMGVFWRLTLAGRKYGRLFDTAKRHNSGTTVTEIKWLRTVLPLLEAQGAVPEPKKAVGK